MNVIVRRVSRQRESPWLTSSQGAFYVIIVSVSPLSIALISATHVKIVSVTECQGVSLTLFVVLFLRVLNIYKSCGYLIADSQNIYYLCAQGGQ